MKGSHIDMGYLEDQTMRKHQQMCDALTTAYGAYLALELYKTGLISEASCRQRLRNMNIRLDDEPEKEDSAMSRYEYIPLVMFKWMVKTCRDISEIDPNCPVKRTAFGDYIPMEYAAKLVSESDVYRVKLKLFRAENKVEADFRDKLLERVKELDQQRTTGS